MCQQSWRIAAWNQAKPQQWHLGYVLSYGWQGSVSKKGRFLRPPIRSFRERTVKISQLKHLWDKLHAMGISVCGHGGQSPQPSINRHYLHYFVLSP